MGGQDSAICFNKPYKKLRTLITSRGSQTVLSEPHVACCPGTKNGVTMSICDDLMKEDTDIEHQLSKIVSQQ